MSTIVKICGLTDDETMDAALAAGADMLGLVFFDKSPRNVRPEQAAELLQFADDVLKVGLFVNADDPFLDQVLSQVRLDMLQFHGTESPERVDYVRREFGLPIMKAIPVASADDLALAVPYYDVADHLLFDAKPPKDAALPGGNAVRFDWSILTGFSCPLPWMLAGGLDMHNVAQAIAVSGTKAVDVSSGVERAPGIKDATLIEGFIRAAKGI